MKRRVALLVETSSSYGREILAGIVRFRREHHEWSVFLEQRDVETAPPSWLAKWNGAGIISRTTTPEFAEAVAKTGVPLVELTDRGQATGFPSVRSDDYAIGDVAAEHLRERGFKNLAVCGFENEAWSTRREKAFTKSVESNSETATLHPAYRSAWYGDKVLPWDEEVTKLVEWIKQLPKPIGIFACNDIRGQHVLEASLNAGVIVPEEVAVVGVDNDEILCQLCDPPLSSVRPNAELVGLKAAEMLSKLMEGEQPEESALLLNPLGVEVRQSTDIVAIEDREIAAALAFIRENACNGISVQDILKNVPVSRSTLERQLRKFLNRSPQQEIRRVQITRAKEMLISTDLSLDRIAHVCGFEHPEYMHVVFKREVEMTPGEYRKSSTT